MKTTFLHNKNGGRKRILRLGAIVALFFALIIFKKSAIGVVSESAMFIGRPFFKISGAAGSWFKKNLFIIEEKKSLLEENIKFKEKLSELEAKNLGYEILKKQNKKLKEILSVAGENKYTAAAILSVPPQSPYDILIIDAGLNKGVEKGARATAYGNIFLGYVTEVFSKTSKVKMISFPEEETNVLISDLNGARVSAIAVGRGGGNLEITLPRSIKVNSGEIVSTLGANPLALGIVDKVIIDPTDPFQKILFRLPVNIRELQYVMIKTLAIR